MTDEDRTLLVDASSFITLAEIRACDLLYQIQGRIAIPADVRREITENPAKSELERAIDAHDVIIIGPAAHDVSHPKTYKQAMEHLDQSVPMIGGEPSWPGDVALLGEALQISNVVVVTDDKPLRKTCKALSIPISGSIGVLVRAVERDEVDAEEAKDELAAMDEVGARLSARLLRRAERLIDEATGGIEND